MYFYKYQNRITTISYSISYCKIQECTPKKKKKKTLSKHIKQTMSPKQGGEEIIPNFSPKIEFKCNN